MGQQSSRRENMPSRMMVDELEEDLHPRSVDLSDSTGDWAYATIDWKSSEDTRIPAEINSQGPQAVKSYQSALEKGSVNVYRASVKIIGQDRAGKTSLKRSLCGLPFIRDHESTVGVEVSTCSPSKSDLKSWQITENEGVIVEDDIASEMAKVYARQGEAKTPDREAVTDIDSIDDADNIPRHEGTNGRQIPEGVLMLLIKFLREKKIDETIEDKEEIISVWDFAGQQLYYASHPVFMARRALYILVYHLGKDLHAKAEPRVRQGTDEMILDNASNETNLDNLLSWLVSVHCLCHSTTNNLDQTEAKLHYARPPVIIVGTHADELKGSDKERNDTVQVMQRKIKDATRECAFRAHIVKPHFVIDNSKSKDDNGVQELHKKKSEVLKEDPYYPQPVPLRWFHFEKALQTLVKEKEKYFMTEKELSEIAEDVCSVNSEEVETMLEFYHLLGIIIKYRDTVVLDVQWLIDLFKSLIIIKPYEEQRPVHEKFWTELEETGRLNNDLVNNIFQELLKCDHASSECDCQAKKDILHMMEHFGLIAKINISDDPKKDYSYLVPSHLTSSPEEKLKKCYPSPGEPCPLYIRFEDGYIPHGLYVQLVCRLCSIFASEEPQLFRNASIFVLDSHSETILTLVCCKSTIKVLMHSQQGDQTDIDCKAVKVKQQIKECLDSFKEQCPWYQGLIYEFCVQCPTCAEKTTSTTDSGKYFGDDVGLHPISKDGERVWCKENMGKLESQNIQCWCSNRATGCSSAKAGPSSEGSALSFTENNKRWLVVGIALMKVLLPTLRDFTRQNISKHYNNLKASYNIDTQSHGTHLKKDGTFELHYESINSNKGNKKGYDYKIKSDVDLAKLYLKPFMAKFSGIDDSCDLSAILGMASSASVFTPATQDSAKDVRENVRNKWGHCNFKKWEDKDFKQCFQSMKNLVKTLSLADDEEKKLLKQLKEWEEKGVHRIGNPDDDLKKAVIQVQKEVQILMEIPGEKIEKITKSLQDYEQRLLKLEETVKQLDEQFKDHDEQIKGLRTQVEENLERPKKSPRDCNIS